MWQLYGCADCWRPSRHAENVRFRGFACAADSRPVFTKGALHVCSEFWTFEAEIFPGVATKPRASARHLMWSVHKRIFQARPVRGKSLARTKQKWASLLGDIKAKYNKPNTDIAIGILLYSCSRHACRTEVARFSTTSLRL